MGEAPARDGIRILAMSGGGYLGLYSAAVLAALEEQASEPIGRRFDLIAGTSVGAITSAAVAFELPLSHLVRFFVEEGREIFSPRAKPSGAVGWLSDGRLILTLIAVQQQHVQAMMEDRLGARYLRLDAEWPADAGLGIDIATLQAAKSLTSLAAQTVRELDRKRLKPFW